MLTARIRSAVHHPTGIHGWFAGGCSASQKQPTDAFFFFCYLGCSMIFGQDMAWAPSSAWLPLIYDTVVVVLVVFRTRELVKARIAGQFQVVTTLVHDGVLYWRYGLWFIILLHTQLTGLLEHYPRSQSGPRANDREEPGWSNEFASVPPLIMADDPPPARSKEYLRAVSVAVSASPCPAPPMHLLTPYIISHRICSHAHHQQQQSITVRPHRLHGTNTLSNEFR